MGRYNLLCLIMFLSLALALFGCQSDDDDDNDDSDEIDDDVIDDDNDDTFIDDDDTETPLPNVLDVVIDPPREGNILSRKVHITTDIPCQLSGYVTTASESGYAPALEQATTQSTSHTLTFAGLLEKRLFRVTIHLAGTPGTALATATFTTPEIPSYAPQPISVVNSDATDPSSWIAISINTNNYQGWVSDRRGAVIMLDREGRVRFYHRTQDAPTMGLQVFSNGDLCINDSHDVWGIRPDGSDYLMFELDALEERVLTAAHHQHHVNDYDAETGLILFNLFGPGYECDMTTPTDKAVGDGVAEFDRDGNTLWYWTVFQHSDELPQEEMDPFHCHVPFWGVGTIDYTHGNKVHPTPDEDTFLLSMRHLHRIIKIDRTTGEIIWQLGDGLDFTWLGNEPVRDRWFYFQHDPLWLSDNRLLLFDNSNCRYGFNCFTNPWSRALELEIDEDNMTVRQVWEHRTDFSNSIGNCERLDNGNTFIVTGSGGHMVETTADHVEIWEADFFMLDVVSNGYTYPALWRYEDPPQ